MTCTCCVAYLFVAAGVRLSMWRVNDRVVPEAAEKTGAAVKSRDENSKLVMRAHCCITIRWSSSFHILYPNTQNSFFPLSSPILLPGPRACRREKIARQANLVLRDERHMAGQKAALAVH